MMLKCGQTGNKHYTFGVTKEQRDAEHTEKNEIHSAPKVKHCPSCSTCCSGNAKFCSSCGGKL